MGIKDLTQYKTSAFDESKLLTSLIMRKMIAEYVLIAVKFLSQLVVLLLFAHIQNFQYLDRPVAEGIMIRSFLREHGDLEKNQARLPKACDSWCRF